MNKKIYLLFLLNFIFYGCSTNNAPPKPRAEVYYNIEDAGILKNRIKDLREGYAELCVTENNLKNCLLYDVWKLRDSYFVSFYTSNQQAYTYFRKEIVSNLIDRKRYELIKSFVPSNSIVFEKIDNSPSTQTLNFWGGVAGVLARVIVETTVKADRIGKDPGEQERQDIERERKYREQQKKNREGWESPQDRQERRGREAGREAWEHGCRGC